MLLIIGPDVASRMKRSVVLVGVAVCTFVLARPALSQTAEAAAATGSPIVSNTVVASWYSEQERPDAPRLVFLLLYRGQPDWHQRSQEANRSGASGHTGRDSMRPMMDEVIVVMHRAGGIDLDVLVDRRTETLRVLGWTLSLKSHNMFLIDNVDSVAGRPQVVGELKINPQLRGLRVQIDEVIAETPALAAFVGRRDMTPVPIR